MFRDHERRRVLVAARPTEEGELRSLFANDALADWEPVEADSFQRARFTLQHTACDVLLVDEGLYHAEGADGLAWLARQGDPPTVFLGGSEAEVCRQAYELGAALCLPRRSTLEHPPLLAAALRRAALFGEAVRRSRRTRATLAQCRRQVDRLVGLLWRTMPLDPQTQWCSQRHVLERLQEEVARCRRHGTPLSVAVSEVQAAGADSAAPETGHWVAQRLNRAKRRCDVAGQYGPQGFLLLMVHTSGSGAVVCCRRLQRALEEPSAAGPGGAVRACFGLATQTEQLATPQALLRAAEERLDAARAGACERVVTE
jgi:diguanylate cyclase (GGDEF)-like protein